MGPIVIAALAASSPLFMVQSSSASLSVDSVARDLLGLDAQIDVAGVVRGFTYTVSSTVVLRSTAVLLSPMAMHGGRLVIEPGARLPSALTLAGTEVAGEIPAGVELRRTRGPSRNQARLMAQLLAFDRPSPGKRTLAEIGRWSPAPSYVLEHSIDGDSDLVVGGVARLTIVSNKVSGALQRGFRSPEGTVLLTAVELTDEPTARAFWKALDSVPERAVSSSVRSALGDGAHWWFVKGKRGCLLWQHDRWFFAVETMLSAGGTTPEILAFTERAEISLSEMLEEQP